MLFALQVTLQWSMLNQKFLTDTLITHGILLHSFKYLKNSLIKLQSNIVYPYLRTHLKNCMILQNFYFSKNLHTCCGVVYWFISPTH